MEKKRKEIFLSEQPVSNPELLFPNILITPLHCQVDPPKLRKNRDYSMKSAHDLFYLRIAEHRVSAAYEWVLNASQRVNKNRLKTN